MIRRVAFFFIALLSFLTSFIAHSQENVWSKRYDTYSWSIELTTVINLWNGDVLMAGDVLVSIDSSGTKKWSKGFTALAGYMPQIKCATTTSDSCIILAGKIYVQNSGNVMCVLKLNRDGEVIWAKTITIGSQSCVYSVCETSDMALILTGEGKTGTGSASDLTVLKMDSTGNLKWCKTIVCSNKGSRGTSIEQTPDGCLIVTGNILNYPSEYVLFLIKLSSNGEVIWAKRQWPTSVSTQGGDVKSTVDGYICLYMDDNNYCHVLKTNSTGDMEWIKRYPFVSDGWFIPPKLCRMYSGGYAFVTPTSEEPFYYGSLFRIDDNGDLIWAKECYSGTINVIQAEDGGLLIFGSSIGGVNRSMEYLRPFGLSKIDSAGIYNSCTDQFTLTPIQVNHGLIDLDLTVISSYTLLSVNLQTGPYTVYPSVGCVEHWAGINESVEDVIQLNITPNPTNGKVIIQILPDQKTKITKVVILNSLGKVVLSNQGERTAFDLTSFSDGIYLVRVEINNRYITRHLILQH